MLRFKILASVVPLAVVAVFARGEFSTGPRPCIEIAGASVQIATLSWQAERHVSFTSDTSRATSFASFISISRPSSVRADT